MSEERINQLEKQLRNLKLSINNRNVNAEVKVQKKKQWQELYREYSALHNRKPNKGDPTHNFNKLYHLGE